nr:hypothetical protein CFP56_13392 [Quercus suber]
MLLARKEPIRSATNDISRNLKCSKVSGVHRLAWRSTPHTVMVGRSCRNIIAPSYRSPAEGDASPLCGRGTARAWRGWNPSRHHHGDRAERDTFTHATLVRKS